MDKVLFVPFSVGGGFLAGRFGKSLFDRIWGLIDDEKAPRAKHREIDRRKLALALVLEGAIAYLIRGLFDHGARQAYLRATGEWPGQEAPEPE